MAGHCKDTYMETIELTFATCPEEEVTIKGIIFNKDEVSEIKGNLAYIVKMISVAQKEDNLEVLRECNSSAISKLVDLVILVCKR